MVGQLPDRSLLASLMRLTGARMRVQHALLTAETLPVSAECAFAALPQL